MSEVLKSENLISRRTAPGEAPGTLVPPPDAPKPVIELLAYRPDEILEKQDVTIQELQALLPDWPGVWINVDGLGDAEIVKALGELFQLHHLALEDVINTHQRPKADHYPGSLFVVVRIAALAQHLEMEQVSLFLGDKFVLTFQEGRPGDCFGPIRERIRQNIGHIRSKGPDYLLYALLDSAVDHYFPILEAYGERLEEMEDKVLFKPHQKTISRIYAIRHELLLIRRAIWPLREVFNTLMRSDEHITEETKLYLRDCYDHGVQLIELVETYRDLTSSLTEVYLSSISHRMNEIMKFLTIMSTIFIPLTFIVGVYGMNFKTELSPWNMPELSWYWGYPFSLALMFSIVFGLVIFFKRKGWLGKEIDFLDK